MTSQERAEACLLGQFIGDSLGSLVEFRSAEQIRAMYPDGVREMADGGCWNTIAGQPTDDSEMALALARAIIQDGGYDQESARAAYIAWLESGPFDVGNTVASGLRGVPNFESQANGALMRISPLGIFGASNDEDLVARWAREDAWITHPHEVTQDANVLFVLTLSRSIAEPLSPAGAYRAALQIAEEHALAEPIRAALERAAGRPPDSYLERQGWVLIALQNAFYQLCTSESFEHGVIDTAMRGGDTDTNAAIAAALLGAVHGRSAIPERWIDTVLHCRPDAQRPEVQRPRPQEYWPVDAIDVARQLLEARPTT